jgi:ABC-type glycerol-3-phosphate transport system substrate-binding protein
MPFAWQNGVELSDGESWTLDTPEMTEALEYYASFFEEGLAPSTPTTSSSRATSSTAGSEPSSPGRGTWRC